jgi:hypothetical protein
VTVLDWEGFEKLMSSKKWDIKENYAVSLIEEK